MKILFLWMLVFSCATYGQVFITVDEDTNEFVESVNYSAFREKRPVLTGTTLNDQPTRIGAEVDSICFSRVDYETLCIGRSALDSVVRLRRKTIAIDEIAVTSKKDKQIILGESNRLVKTQARPISADILYGVILRNPTASDLRLTEATIFVRNVNFKTKYRVKFFEVEESTLIGGSQSLEWLELAFATDTLTLSPGAKKAEIDLQTDYLLSRGAKLFASVELIGYFDSNDKPVNPPHDQLTKLEFQLSERLDFYSRTADYHTKVLSSDLRNINLQINYDFAHRFFRTPHKSILVAPAILLTAERTD